MAQTGNTQITHRVFESLDAQLSDWTGANFPKFCFLGHKMLLQNLLLKIICVQE